jgi:hypothetical protein
MAKSILGKLAENPKRDGAKTVANMTKALIFTMPY